MVDRLEWLHVFVDVPGPGTSTRDFWSRVLGWSVGRPWERHPELVSLEPPHGDTFVHVQEIGAPPRVHLDLVVDDLDRVRRWARDLGAEPGPSMPSWQVMRSPGGLPFCLCLEPRDGRRPGATTWPAGHRSRLALVCLDIPDRLYAGESEFWQRLTGWTRGAGRFPEFEWLVGPATATVRLLFQRLGPDDSGSTTRAHIDLGTDDVDSEAERVAGLGAQRIEKVRDWVVLEDPVGLPFCVTPRSPD